ncbi:conserved hypothetical protein [Thiobacillus denitrificans ATCC 25259]|uniref:Outer membrane protein assembly factor BamE n=1 Tax=Thiobacillus denitrificans (strain ATCC 25259 / T1) TaxID=292415 RepID=Q3SJS3_THIDA|nr:outer membrane protein assembly factor BamE [Thiobacillus denitrificans]AAZ97077.1 conserved hypothetical protein [Thiobacillus denitrificans ATCC 25259]
MPRLLISVLLVALVAGCSIPKLGPHRIDVQQGNALDQENVSRLKPGLNRSQVRFLLGTPLVVDPFRGDRWDYVYVYYKAGKLAEQKRITLHFDGDTLARIEGDVPQEVAEAQAQQAPPAPEADAAPAAASVTAVQDPASASAPEPAAANVAEPASAPAAAPTQVSGERTSETSAVAPRSSPEDAPASVDSPAAAGALRRDTDVAKIHPDVTPAFPGSEQAAPVDAALLKALTEWADAWSRRDSEAYFAAYDAHFVPDDGASREAWRRRKLQAFDATKALEVKVDAPAAERTEEGAVALTFKQFFRSDTYRDAVLKRLLMVERDGRWLIVEEKVLQTLERGRP